MVLPVAGGALDAVGCAEDQIAQTVQFALGIAHRAVGGEIEAHRVEQSGGDPLRAVFAQHIARADQDGIGKAGAQGFEK